MNEQLVRENQGLESISVIAAQFLQERMIGSPEVERGASTHDTVGNKQAASSAVLTEPSPGESRRRAQVREERGINTLEKRRGELEGGIGGDHDVPYRFTLPTVVPPVLAWVKLMVRVHNGDLQP
jgi:hypothetical protein